MNEKYNMISMHQVDGWRGQLQRIIRWDERLNNFNCDITDINHLNDFLDTLYATYQNIYHLKDWLYNDKILDCNTLNKFINNSLEIGLCRDIANGTKHFTLRRNFSVCNKFIISSMWDPFSNDKYWSYSKIRIISKAGVFDPFGLSKKCIIEWSSLLMDNKILIPYEEIRKNDEINPKYFEPNIQRVFGKRLRRNNN